MRNIAHTFRAPRIVASIACRCDLAKSEFYVPLSTISTTISPIQLSIAGWQIIVFVDVTHLDHVHFFQRLNNCGIK